ncbi:MAG: HEAT repeat domain-containing protein [Pseudomonadota bacterium]
MTKLESALPDTRWAAARELAARRDARAVEAIIRAMRDPQGTIRVCVMASALGHLRDPRALGALTEAAFDPVNRDLRLCAIQSLGMIGDASAVPALIRALQEGNMPVAAANAIARMGDERGVLPIIQAAGDPQLRLWMVMALGELGSPSALSWLETLHEEQITVVYQAAVEARWKIAQLLSEQPLVALTSVLTNEPAVNRRMWAAFRLGELRYAAAIPALVDALGDSSCGVRGRAAAALVRTGDAALPILRSLAESSTTQERLYVVAILGYSGKLRDISLLQAITDKATDKKLANVARRSIELIHSFSRPQGGLIEFAAL